MSEKKRPLLVLIDGHAVAYRAYFAISSQHFSTDSGEPTNATYGFTRTLMDVLDESPDYFAISFDAGLSGREDIYPEYKGTREKMPDDLRVQIQRILEVVDAFNIPTLAIEGYEADDVIGTVTKQAEALGCDIRVITGDRDLLQLVTEHTLVQLPQRNDSDKVYGLADFREKYGGLEPHQLTDIKGLSGDNSDNIPGVEKIGDKTAVQLITNYGSVEGVYEHIEDFKGKRREYLERDRTLAFLSKDLATIRRDLPIQIDLKACVTHDYNAAKVVQIFRELQFRTLMSRLRNLHSDEYDEGDAVVLDEASAIEMKTIIVDDATKLKAMVNELEKADWIGFDTETTGIDQMQALLVGISLSADPERAYYIPVGHINPESASDVVGGVDYDGHILVSAQKGKPRQATIFDEPATAPDDLPPQLPLKTVMDAIRPALTNPNIQKVAHNASYDVVMLRRYGIDVSPVGFDTMIAEWVRNPASRNLGLKNLVSDRLQKTMQEITTLIGKGAKQISFAKVPIERAAPYACADAAMVLPLHEDLVATFENDNIRSLYDNVEMPLIPIIADIQMRGVLLDSPFLKTISQELEERMAALEQEIYTESGYGEFNINSGHQLNDVLFGKLQLPTDGLKKTKSGQYSLTAGILDDMQHMHPVIDMILEYRQLGKLKSTYVDALPALVNPETGRVHTSYNQTGTVTGRFSSQDPNLQNIPIRTEEGRRVRKAFLADKGHVLLAVDYSQIELRILAHFSQDEALLDAFRQGLDIHTSTAAAVHHVPMAEVTFEQRSFAKSVNFGLMYGMSAFRLARDSGLSHGEARDFITTYFERFPGVKAYLDNSKEQAKVIGYVETILGRRRYFPELQSEGNDQVTHIRRQAAEREAINMPIQGTAADLLKIAMINLHKTLRADGFGAQMILQVHDELVLEVPQAELNEVVPLVKDIMENAYPLNVPLQAEAKVGENWYEMEKLG